MYQLFGIKGIEKEEENFLNIMTDMNNYNRSYNVILDYILNSNNFN